MAKAKNTYSWDCKTVDCYPSKKEGEETLSNLTNCEFFDIKDVLKHL